MRYDKDKNTVEMDSSEFSKYAFRKSKKVFFSSLKSVEEDVYSAYLNSAQKYKLTLDRELYSLAVESPYIIFDSENEVLTILIEKKINSIHYYFHEIFAESVLGAYIFKKVNSNINGFTLSIIIKTDKSVQSVDETVSHTDIDLYAEKLIGRIGLFADYEYYRKEVGQKEIKEMSFPYDRVRSGQKDVMLSVLRAMRNGTRLMISAPTGSGKTVSALYPSIKALGEGYIEKIFYLTGKGESVKSVIDTLKMFKDSCPSIRYVEIKAKDKCCSNGLCRTGCTDCPLRKDLTLDGKYISFKERLYNAVGDYLSGGRPTAFSEIKSLAEKHNLCSHDLTLEISEYCDIILFDYNYYFDDKIRLRRYFSGKDFNYGLLVDEAHNLPDRVREMYSSDFPLKEIISLSDDSDLKDTEGFDRFVSLAGKVTEEVSALKEICLSESDYSGEEDGKIYGFFKSKKMPDNLKDSVINLYSFLSGNKEISSTEKVYSLKANLLSFIGAMDYDESSIFFAELSGDDFRISIYNIDPGNIIDRKLSENRSAVLFSATLNPVDYYLDMFRCTKDDIIEMDSPFDKENLLVTVYDHISTRLKDRAMTAPKVAEVIRTVTESKKGNYIVFLPSFEYLNIVAKQFAKICGDKKIIVQGKNMTFREKGNIVSALRKNKNEGIIAFFVLGGSFSESIDLTEDELLGTIIIGIGISGISSKLNLISEYFDAKYDAGWLYAYAYPSINKIEQAAGRVIRTESDRGVVVIVDDRISSKECVMKFPRYWSRPLCVSDCDSLSVILDNFWSKE